MLDGYEIKKTFQRIGLYSEISFKYRVLLPSRPAKNKLAMLTLEICVYITPKYLVGLK